MNQQQVGALLRTGLAAGGPLGALILSRTAMARDDYELYVNALLFFLPLVSAAWGWIVHRRTSQIKAVAKMDEVATVVVKDAANGAVGALARDDHPNIVTASQNEQDAKAGKKAA